LKSDISVEDVKARILLKKWNRRKRSKQSQESKPASVSSAAFCSKFPPAVISKYVVKEDDKCDS
jgi:hypothetical protein